MKKTPKPNKSLRRAPKMERQFLPGQRQLRVAFAEREKVPFFQMAGRKFQRIRETNQKGCNATLGQFLGTQNGNFLTCVVDFF